MEPDVRNVLLAVGIAFCALLAAMTLIVIAESGFDILVLVSLVTVGLIAAGLIGAIRNPPDE